MRAVGVPIVGMELDPLAGMQKAARHPGGHEPQNSFARLKCSFETRPHGIAADYGAAGKRGLFVAHADTYVFQSVAHLAVDPKLILARRSAKVFDFCRVERRFEPGVHPTSVDRDGPDERPHLFCAANAVAASAGPRSTSKKPPPPAPHVLPATIRSASA